MAPDALIGIAKLLAAAGQRNKAARLLGLVFAHPAATADHDKTAAALLSTLEASLGTKELRQALEAGKGLALETTARHILEERARTNAQT